MNQRYDLSEVVAFSRSPDWKYGKGFYAAVVATERRGSKLFAYCRIHIADTRYCQDEQLGVVNSKEEARSVWGRLEWTADSLIIGSQPGKKIVVKRSEIETHR